LVPSNIHTKPSRCYHQADFCCIILYFYLTVSMEPFYSWRWFTSDIHVIFHCLSSFDYNRFQVCTIYSWFHWNETNSRLKRRSWRFQFVFWYEHITPELYKIHLPLNAKVNLQALCLTRWDLVGSDAGDGPALFTATTRNWYSALSLRSGTFASSWSPGTSIAFSQSGLNLRTCHW
jgi:hypothetical protein